MAYFNTLKGDNNVLSANGTLRISEILNKSRQQRTGYENAIVLLCKVWLYRTIEGRTLTEAEQQECYMRLTKYLKLIDEQDNGQG